MKKNYFLKTFLIFFLSGFFSTAHAATIYLSVTGNDNNNGLTAGTAVKSFSKAQALAVSSDTIMVSGMIDFVSDPANSYTPQAAGLSTTKKAGIILTKNLTVQGTSAANDGFQGADQTKTQSTRFIQILGDFTLTLKNLKLANGAISTDVSSFGGGAIYVNVTPSNNTAVPTIVAGTVFGSIVAENMIFDNNIAIGHKDITGGAILINGTNANGNIFKNCVFNANIAEKAGAIYYTSWLTNSTIRF
ncbi:MAG: hypothetical protein ACRC6O_05145 [Flavobacterium sp.]